MTDTLAKVAEWHRAFAVPVRDHPALPEDRAPMRLRILEEEVGELREAVEAGDMVSVLDALCDIQYVLDGTFLEFGLHALKGEAFDEVHASNMSKLGDDGRPVLREDGKVLKGPGYAPPDLTKVLRTADAL